MQGRSFRFSGRHAKVMDPSPPPSQEFLLNALCTRCGYDLAANNISGPCPKCGLELSYAAFQSGLANANPLWLQRIYLGIIGLIVAQIIFAFQSGTQLLGILSRSDEARQFTFWWNRLYETAVVIQWFSALFLLAAPEHRARDEARTSPRKVLLWLGGAYIIIHLIFPPLSSIFLLRRVSFVPHLLSLIYFASILSLFLYVQRLGQRDGNPVVKRHLPIAGALIILNAAIQFILPFSGVLRPVDDVTQLLSTAAAVYLIYVLLKLRKSLVALLPTSASDPLDAFAPPR
ncbi:MAG TPA: hypothetical protein VGQ99_07470 [Tepidisphaeraceae bacterium]|jgi:hypothetical protein|nr:hypothetical protein [Tepidisphaeraceae bacterium]